MLASRRKCCTKGHLYTLETTAYYITNHQRFCLLCKNPNNCPHGHALMGDNLIIRHERKSGVKCRECSRSDSLMRKYKKESFLSKEELRLLNRKRNLEHFYKLSPEKYEILLKEQGYKCANKFCPHSYYSDELYVDHDHSCCEDYKGRVRKTCGKCIRGLLCRECNFVLGKVKDEENSLLGLVEYLRKWKKYTQESTLEAMKIT